MTITCTGCQFFDIICEAEDKDPALGRCTWKPKGGFPPSFKFALREVITMYEHEEHNCPQKEISDD